MSGPIVRRYGFPNFEKIFGERELKHGAEGDAATAQPTPTSETPAKTAEETKPTTAGEGPSKS
jgi:hypothetical protein